jgi:hypothetical protein
MGIFRFDFLDEVTSRRWEFDQRPGQQLLTESKDMGLTVKSNAAQTRGRRIGGALLGTGLSAPW